MDEIEIERQRERMLAAGRLAEQLGVVALRTTLLVNAGAIVALLALVGQLWGARNGALLAVLAESHWFFWGLIAALLATVLAYGFGSADHIREEKFYKLMRAGTVPPDPYAKDAPLYLHDLLGALLLIVGAASYGLFAFGAWCTLRALGG